MLFTPSVMANKVTKPHQSWEKLKSVHSMTFIFQGMLEYGPGPDNV